MCHRTDTFQGLITESVSNKNQLSKLMSFMEDSTKTVQDFLNVLSYGPEENPNLQNCAIKNGIEESRWNQDDKKKAIIASRYLNSVGKGENALDLAVALEDNLAKYGSDEYVEFNVPEYIKEAIEWICK